MARRDKAIADVLDQFVCVRLIQAVDIDLTLFQFDYEQTWVAFFLNADRTIYGRYGTRTSRDREDDVSLAGFRKAAEAALKIHEDRAKWREILKNRVEADPTYKGVRDMPAFPAPIIRANGKRNGCVHCHHIATGEIFSRRKQGLEVRDRDFWRYPMPNVLGLILDPEERATVSKVKEDSTAAKAGFRIGDELVTFAGQPLTSIADVQWVLHTAPEKGQLPVEVARNGEKIVLSLPLTPGWRRSGDVSWRDTNWPTRFRILGFKASTATNADLRRNQLPATASALVIDQLAPGYLRERNVGPQKNGIRPKDVITAIDGKSEWVASESMLHAYLMQNTRPGTEITLTLLRNGQRRQVTFPVQ